MRISSARRVLRSSVAAPSKNSRMGGRRPLFQACSKRSAISSSHSATAGDEVTADMRRPSTARWYALTPLSRMQRKRRQRSQRCVTTLVLTHALHRQLLPTGEDERHLAFYRPFHAIHAFGDLTMSAAGEI